MKVWVDVQLDDFAAFDVFKVARLSQQRPLKAVTMALIQRYDLIAKLSLPVGKLISFLQVQQLSPRLISQTAECCPHLYVGVQQALKVRSGPVSSR